MFETTAQVLMAGVFGEGVAKNAFLESFAIHTRILKEFFHPSGAKDNVVLAEHYFDDRMTWRRVRGRLPKALDVDRRVGTEIAHLTYDRLDVTPEAKNWNIPEIWMAMTQLVTTFVQHASPQRLSHVWASSAESAKASATATNSVTTGTTASPQVTLVNSPSVKA